MIFPTSFASVHISLSVMIGILRKLQSKFHEMLLIPTVLGKL